MERRIAGRDGGRLVFGRETRRPPWLRKKRNLSDAVLCTKAKLHGSGLHTVCESARCPNLAECFGRGVATIMILGEHCTRDCRFCAVDHGPPERADPREGEKIARFVRKVGISFLVITSVTRDDLSDGGASHFVDVTRTLRALVPELAIELLVPDFSGTDASVVRVAELPIEVFGHNVETVRRLYSSARRQADYERSLSVLKTAGRVCGERTMVKSGIMVGLGETEEELLELFGDLARTGVDILTIGQYLRPSRGNLEVFRYYRPEDFERLEQLALLAGVSAVKSGPYVRSSYLAEENCAEARSKVSKKKII